MASAKEQFKKNAYDKRKSDGWSEPAPLEEDSDPDFNPGVYIPEKKLGKGKKRGALGRKRKLSDDDNDAVEYPKAKRRSRPPTNPLAEFFGEDFVFDSDSSEEEDIKEDDMEEDEEEEEEEESVSVEQPRSWKILQELKKVKPKDPPKPPPPEPDGEHSLTEDEDDTPPPPPPGKQLAPPSMPVKKPTPQPVQDDGELSVTEDESDYDIPPVLPPSKYKSQPQPPEEEDGDVSLTESEDEEPPPPPPSRKRKPTLPKSLIPDPRMRPRPGFPLKEGQEHLPPLVLDEAKGIQVPGTINTYLRPYQRDGVQFFWERYSKGIGGLLGDDMGLGKTIQVIGFLSAIMGKTGLKTDRKRRYQHVLKLMDRRDWRKFRKLPPANETWPTALIIAPKSVVGNWLKEFETWGYFEVGEYTGPNRKDVLKEFKHGRLDVLITTPGAARTDIEELRDLPISIIFIDEAHSIKNTTSKSSIAFDLFDCLVRFGMTGTAIQNTYEELWALLNWTNPGAVGTKKEWHRLITKRLQEGQSLTANEDQRVIGLYVATVLRDKILPRFFLRRTKAIIKDQLPLKHDQVVFCPLTPPQAAAYKHVLALDEVQNLIRKDDPCECGSQTERKKCCHPIDKADLLRYMSILILLSNHLALILPSPNDTPEQIQRYRALATRIFPGQKPNAMLEMDAMSSGKWKTLETLLKAWREEDETNKVLIFTKSVKLLRAVEYQLQRLAYKFRTLEGATKDRMRIVDEFQTDPEIFVFLISTLAGGTGLNLTAANKVVIFDPNWNPAHDLQAMDRAFRFGQTRDVDVYRLLGAGSLEELIYARQLYKQQQMAIGYEASFQTRYFEGIQGDKNAQGELFGIKNIFKLQEGKLATKAVIENAAVAELDWALAHMPVVKSKGRKLNDGIEADRCIGKEDASLRGLGAFLFDDTPPQTGHNDIEKLLSSVGVKYSHHNDQILQESKVEEARVRLIMKKKHKSRKSNGASSSRHTEVAEKPQPVWPPVRKHHKKKAAERAAAAPPPPPASELDVAVERLRKRQRALIELKYIDGPSDLAAWAQNDFLRCSKQEQENCLACLDEFSAQILPESDSE